MTKAPIGTLPRHYDRLGLTRGVIQDWEGGLRTAAADAHGRTARMFVVTFEHSFTLDVGAAGAYLRFTGDVTLSAAAVAR